MNYIWSSGEKYEKSYKKDKPSPIQEISKIQETKKTKKTKFDLEEIITQQVVGLKSNKREEANEKMTERYLISQTQQNPFLATNNYIQDLDIQSKFLIPRSEANTPNYSEI